MANQIEIRDSLAELKDIASAGYALAFHVRFTTPTFLFQTYPKDWLDHYSQNGLVMSDPTVAWGFENVGAISWSELSSLDSKGVLKSASGYGLNFGTTCALEVDGSRSIGSFARADREFTDQERDVLIKKMDHLHAAMANIKTLSPETAAALRMMSVQFTHT
jgi:LuxR family transcriptional regulator, quorum-sensing system regulator SdiA